MSSPTFLDWKEDLFHSYVLHMSCSSDSVWNAIFFFLHNTRVICQPVKTRTLFHTPAANHVRLFVYKNPPRKPPSVVFSLFLLFRLSLLMSHFLSFSLRQTKASERTIASFLSLSVLNLLIMKWKRTSGFLQSSGERRFCPSSRPTWDAEVKMYLCGFVFLFQQEREKQSAPFNGKLIDIIINNCWNNLLKEIFLRSKFVPAEISEIPALLISYL